MHHSPLVPIVRGVVIVWLDKPFADSHKVLRQKASAQKREITPMKYVTFVVESVFRVYKNQERWEAKSKIRSIF